MDLLAREKKIKIELEQVLARVLEEFAPDTTIADFNVNKITREFVKDSGITELLNMACDSEKLTNLKDFLTKKKSAYQKKVVKLEKQETDAKNIILDEPDRKDVKEDLYDVSKQLNTCNAIIELIEEIEQFS